MKFWKNIFLNCLKLRILSFYYEKKVLKQYWSSLPPISTKQTTTFHLKSFNTTKTMTFVWTVLKKHLRVFPPPPHIVLYLNYLKNMIIFYFYYDYSRINASFHDSMIDFMIYLWTTSVLVQTSASVTLYIVTQWYVLYKHIGERTNLRVPTSWQNWI